MQIRIKNYRHSIAYDYEIFHSNIIITVKVSGRMGLRNKTTLDRLESIANSIPNDIGLRVALSAIWSPNINTTATALLNIVR